MLGRMVFGFSAEVNEVAQNALINNWFDGKILSIASGLAQVFNNLGEASSQFFTGDLFSIRKHIADSYFGGVVVTGISISLLLVFMILDKKYEPFLKWERKQAYKENEKGHQNTQDLDDSKANLNNSQTSMDFEKGNAKVNKLFDEKDKNAVKRNN